MIEWIAGAAGITAAGIASYGAIAPEAELFGDTLHRLADPQQIALTFDDGPNDPYTLHLLDVLARHDVKATFFMIGHFVRERPQIARAVAEAGHVVGNHTDSHPNLIGCSSAQVRIQLGECERVLSDA